jgi:hypothetical protein
MEFQPGSSLFNQEGIQPINRCTPNSQAHIEHLENLQDPKTKILCLAYASWKAQYQRHDDLEFFNVEFNDDIISKDCPQDTIMQLFFECSFNQSFLWAIGLV